MASAFDHSGMDYVPRISDAQWDSGKKAMIENTDILEREAKQAGLALFSMIPSIAPFVPLFSKALGVQPSTVPLQSIEILVDALNKAKQQT